MAANYGELLTVDQFRDLVAYLQSLGGPLPSSDSAGE